MSSVNNIMARAWTRVGPQFMPFADAASADLPLGRLLRLSLFQVSVGMAMALMVGTLNRVMIVELGISAWIVAVAVALPLVFAPFLVRYPVLFSSSRPRLPADRPRS